MTQPKEEAWKGRFEEWFASRFLKGSYTSRSRSIPWITPTTPALKLMRSVEGYIESLLSTERQRHEEEMGEYLMQHPDATLADYYADILSHPTKDKPQ